MSHFVLLTISFSRGVEGSTGKSQECKNSVIVGQLTDVKEVRQGSSQVSEQTLAER